jgi:small subunit ribosomal protein S16
MLTIRLYRTGTNNRPYYRIVAIDSRRKRQGRALEVLGTYDPRGGGAVNMRSDAVERWLARGATPSDTVRSLIKKQKRASQAAPETAS